MTRFVIPDGVKALAYAIVLALASVGCRPPAQPAPARVVVVNAESYAIGRWHLGEPMQAFATSKPDLWKVHGLDTGNHGEVALSIGSRRHSTDDPLKGSHLVFFGTSYGVEPSKLETDFVPTLAIALGKEATELFAPPLPSGAALGEPTLVIEKSFGQPKGRQAAGPKSFRIENHASRLATVAVDGQALGFMLGEIPQDPEDPLYKVVRRLIETHLRLR